MAKKISNDCAGSMKCLTRVSKKGVFFATRGVLKDTIFRVPELNATLHRRRWRVGLRINNLVRHSKHESQTSASVIKQWNYDREGKDAYCRLLAKRESCLGFL